MGAGDTVHNLHRCRFPTFAPQPVTALALTPPSFDASTLRFGGHSGERGLLAVARASGDVELMLWGGRQGWLFWRMIPSSFPLLSASSSSSPSKKPLSLLSHLVFTHQTTLSSSDIALYSNDEEGTRKELSRLKQEGVRLFGVGGVGSELVEWEWGGPGSRREVGRVKSTLPTLPPIFSLAASSSASHLAISCEDSTIRILSILDGELELVAKLELGGLGKVRGVSLAWGPCVHIQTLEKDDDDEVMTNGDAVSPPSSFQTPLPTSLLVGCSDSSLRLFDRSSISSPFTTSHRMTVDRVPGEHTVVWTCSFLGDGSQMVSGDSMGNLKFWDRKTGTQVATFRAHQADVLALCVNPEGTQVFTSGVDQKTCELRLAKSPSPRWILSSGRRMHVHDVRALALDSHPVPILTSGGLDMSLVTVHASLSKVKKGKERGPGNEITGASEVEFGTSNQRKASYVPQHSSGRGVHLSTTADGAKLVIVRGSRTVSVWRIDGESEGWKKEVEMDLKLQTNLIASAVSPDSKYLAVSDLYETKLFLLTSVSGKILPRRQKALSTSLSDVLPLSLGTGSSCLTFSKDSRKLVLATAFGGALAIVDLEVQDDNGKFPVSLLKVGSNNRPIVNGDRKIQGPITNGTTAHDSDDDSDDDVMSDVNVEERQREVALIEVSADGKYVAVSDLQRSVDIWDLLNLRHYTTLPTLETVPTVITFSNTTKSSEPVLIFAFPDNSLSTYSLTSHKLRSHPTTLLDMQEPALGIAVAPQLERQDQDQGTTTEPPFVVWGANWVARVSLSDLVSTRAVKTNGKRKHEDSLSEGRHRRQVLASDEEERRLVVKLTRKYSPLVLFDFAMDGEIVVVERVWSDVARQKGMPDPWVRSGEFAT